MTLEELKAQRAFVAQNEARAPVEGFEWEPEAKEQFLALEMFTEKKDLPERFIKYGRDHAVTRVDSSVMEAFVKDLFSQEAWGPILNILNTLGRKF